MSTLNVDKVDPSTGTALEIGSSGDTVTVPSGATLTLTSATLNLPTTITSTTEVKTNKVSPATGTDFALGDSGDTFTVPSGATIVNSGTATGFGITTASFRPNVKPVIINGDMGVAQRSTSVTGTSSGNGWTTVDRWRYWIGTAGTWTITQETLTADEAFEDGFTYAWKWDCTTANASLSAGSYLSINTSLEAQNCALFKKGTSEAEVMTLAFWVKSTKTGTQIVNIYDAVNDREICQAYTIDATNTWEKKVLTYPGDTSGPLGTGTTKAIEVKFWVVAGTNYTSGTLQTSWGGATTADGAVGQVNNADSTSNNFHLTGVQLEVGSYTSSTIPSFQHEDYGSNLLRCQRFYQKFGGNGYEGIATGRVQGATAAIYSIVYNTAMKSDAPAIGETGALINTDRATFDKPVTGFSTTSTGIYSAFFTTTNASESLMDAGEAIILATDNGVDGWLTFDSEM